MENISKHISLKEATKSDTAIRKGISNQPDAQQLAAMRLVAEKIFEPLREWAQKPIGLTSFFRSPELNVAIGGAANSQHSTGEAMDIDADVFSNGLDNIQIFNFIKDKLDFDQLIAEFVENGKPQWVHASYSSNPNKKNRKQVLIAVKEGSKTVYKPYSPELFKSIYK